MSISQTVWNDQTYTESLNLTLPESLHATAGATCALDGIRLSGISPDRVVLLSLVVGHGRLSVGRAVQPRFILGKGRDDSHMSFYGSLKTVNAVLGSLRYRTRHAGDDTLAVAVALPGVSGDQARTGSALCPIRVAAAPQQSLFEDPELTGDAVWNGFRTLGYVHRHPAPH